MGGFFSFEQDLVGKCAQVIIQAGSPISYFIPKQKLMKSGMIRGFREKEWGLYSRCCEKYFWALRKESINPPYAMLMFDFPAGKGKISVISMECL